MNNYYSQYGEDKVLSNLLMSLGYTGGNILDIGANDGKILSNSLHFIERGWGATLIEASPKAFDKLQYLHKENSQVQCIQSCLDETSRQVNFYHNITHFYDGDTDLLSTIDESSFENSNREFPFEKISMNTETFEQVKKKFKYGIYQIISIDIEGKDFEILKQINLDELSCNFLIIEYNGDINKKKKIINYCDMFNLNNILLDNKTNIILTK